jgi:hypothetical protein
VERYEHEPTSPAGQVDAWGDLAAGWRSNPAGRRRALRMLAWLGAVVVVLTALLVLLLR